ncbi:MAG TPA: methyltransferase domain-containing protein [Candidatus Dormibacteraeota bacterium]
MSDLPACCSPKGYRWVFSERSARSEARRYRRKGLDATSRQIVDFLKSQGVEGRTVLEVGGGIGAIQIELLKAGAAHATSVELTPSYEEVAKNLLEEAGFTDRADRQVKDFAASAAEVDGADIVVMNRVLCCYHDMPGLAGAAADHAQRLLILSYPRRTWWTRASFAVFNWFLALLRREFHVFVHKPQDITATAGAHGLAPILDRRGAFWTVAALRRTA